MSLVVGRLESFENFEIPIPGLNRLRRDFKYNKITTSNTIKLSRLSLPLSHLDKQGDFNKRAGKPALLKQTKVPI